MADRIYKPILKDVFVTLLKANEKAMPKAWKRFISPDFEYLPAMRVFDQAIPEVDMTGVLYFEH